MRETQEKPEKKKKPNIWASNRPVVGLLEKKNWTIRKRVQSNILHLFLLSWTLWIDLAQTRSSNLKLSEIIHSEHEVNPF